MYLGLVPKLPLAVPWVQPFFPPGLLPTGKVIQDNRPVLSCYISFFHKLLQRVFPQTAEIHFLVWFALATVFAEYQMAPDQFALTNWKWMTVY